MKTNYWWLVAATLSTGLMAQTNSSAPTAAPAPNPASPEPAPAMAAAPATTNAPSAPAAKKAPAKKKPAARAPKPVKLVNLAPGPTLVTASNVNVRGQASLSGEVITRLTKGDTVTVIEQITLEKPKADEPAQWARIAFPTNAHVFVNALFIDATNKTVTPAKLNLRAGAGENFSVVGTLRRGDAINEIVTKGDWMEIEVPTNAFAFIAAEYLKSEAPVVTAEPAPVTTPPLVVTPIVTTPAETNAPAPPVVAVEATNVVAATNEPIAIVATNEPPAKPAVVEEPPAPPRIVQREGIVRSTWSIQAPTPFALVNAETGETLNYLYTTSPELNLKRYRGVRVVVTGEEGLDKRWRNTPVLTIQRIQVPE